MATARAARGARIAALGWTYRYPGRRDPAVRDVSFTVEPGQIVVLLGASGSGKSTLLSGLAGVLPDGAAEGTLIVELPTVESPAAGPEVASSGTASSQAASPGAEAAVPALEPSGTVSDPVRSRVGLVSQDPQSNVVMEFVGDDLAFPLENLGIERSALWDRVHQARRAVGLTAKPDRSTARLSGGQLQLLAVGAATIGSPGLLLLDEPTANLDAEAAEAVVRTVLAERARTGCTVVVIEHRVRPWLEQADRVLVADAGTVTPLRVPDLPEHLRTRPGLAERVWLDDTDLPHRPARIAPGPAVLTAVRVEVPERLAATDLGARAGEVVALTGPPGSGKSTLLACLAGLHKPSRGRVDLADGRHDPWEWPAGSIPRTFGVVFQNPEHQFLTGSVRGELEHGQDPHHPAVAARVDDLLARLHLTALADADPFTLSGGEQRRLSVATALVAQPDVLLLDEPTFGQDPTTWRELVAIIAEHRDAGGAVVLATHDPLLVHALGARRLPLTGVASERPTKQPATPAPDATDAPRPRGLRSLDPLALLGTAVLVTVAALLSASVPFNLGLAALAVVAGLLGGLSARWCALLAFPALVAAGSVALSNALLGEHGLLAAESWQAAALPASRIIAVAVPGLVAAAAMDPTGLADSLVARLRVGPRPAYAVLAGLRLLPLLADEWQVLARASRARGLGGRGLAPRGRLFASMAFRLLVSALRRGARLAVALDIRGLTGSRRRTIARPVGWRVRDTAGCAGGMLALLAAVATRV